MTHDIWHYPRIALAEQIVNMFDTGLSSALIFFAPRRMGKTEFLLKDIKPVSAQKGWHTFYFSFLDCGEEADDKFMQNLTLFANDIGVLKKIVKKVKHIKKLNGGIGGLIQGGIEFQDDNQPKTPLEQLITALAHNGRYLLLMDEVQALAFKKSNETFIASLRTALDINKDNVKCIFTGSSREGLRKMFSESSAPFFHFGQSLPFPELDKGFTDHLATIFSKVTNRTLNTDELWTIFQEMGKIPQIARSLVERSALNPHESLQAIKTHLLQEISDDREYVAIWDDSSHLEKTILLHIAKKGKALFGTINRQHFAKMLGIDEVPVSTIQSTVRVLLRKKLIGKDSERGDYYIEDPSFIKWLSKKDSIL